MLCFISPQGDEAQRQEVGMNKPKNIVTGVFSGCFTSILIQLFLTILPALLIALILLMLTAIHPDLVWAGILVLFTPLIGLREPILLACGWTIGLGMASGGLIGLFSSSPFFGSRPYLSGILISILVHLLAGTAAGAYFAFGSQQPALAWPGFVYLACPGPLVGLLTVFIVWRGRKE